MVYSTASRITKQWWGATHFRIGSRGQPRPNKGFKLTHFKTVGEAVECLRWWKRLRRGTLAHILNSSKSSQLDLTDSTQVSQEEIIRSRDLEALENGKAVLDNSQLELLSRYLGADLLKQKKKKFRSI
ncbi:hypothetical protein BEWA_003200 [Theileria equi strain WA]|uniref:Uncharacterized protein n=1 Tax=Theileria equi strain WA TaxID=1537102 RepID=L0AZB1_THEEQ|nr:hypothetical protein BEWA_003200 [Theileria equi strain WA]AFZ80912.1 hypothetical protein BEWA_003200 [Theileria equi strain WA]|eukprot:XP_004830578.1 hypothetical protein BEWA_003200 [Theileria equi strain WA]